MFFYWALYVSRKASCEITVVHLSVRLFVRPSARPSIIKFSQDWIKKNDDPILGHADLNQAQNEVFRYFIEFES